MKKHLIQITRFGFIGALAAGVHITAVAFQVESFNVKPLLANILAFILAFQVSYFGHKHWTFKRSDLSHAKSMPKFFIVALGSFILNESLYTVLLNLFHLQYIVALILVLMIVPIVTFTFSKTWAFN